MAVLRLATIGDRDWVRQSFMLSKDAAKQSATDWMYYCSADSKFTNTRLGNNFTINNPPQYTPYADPRHKGLLQERYTHEGFETGIGHYYSEQLDDNGVKVTMRFGFPEYNGMFSFFTGFYDNDAASLANTGVVHKAFFTIGQIAGLVFSIRFWPLIALNAMGNIGRFMTGSPSSKYYYLDPAMYTYYNRCNFIANTLAVQMGLVPRQVGPLDDGNGSKDVNDQPMRDLMHEMAPDIFRKSGGIDLYALSTKAQRMASRRIKKLDAAISGKDLPDDIYTQLRQFALDARLSGSDDPNTVDSRVDNPTNVSIENYLKAYYDGAGRGSATRSKEYQLADTLKSDAATTNPDGTSSPVPVDSGAELTSAQAIEAARAAQSKLGRNMRPIWDQDYIDGLEAERDTEGNLTGYKGFDREKALVKPGWWNSLNEQFNAGVMDGDMFVSFRVDNPGTIQHSFSNSIKDSDISGKLNGMVNNARNARFTFQDGKIGGAAGAVIGTVTDAVGGLIGGVLDGVHLSGLMSLAGAAFVDIPKVWDNSSANLPTASFNIQLRSPYGNKFSRFQNLYVPISMLLAAALPISTGKQSYTSPFICECYSRGRHAIRLGMITSLSITRGVGSLGWNNNDEPLGFDVSFEVTDLSSIIHAPIHDRISSILPWKGLMDDDNSFGDFMNVMSSLSLEDMVYPYNKWMLNITKKREFYRAFASGPQVGSILAHGFPGRIMAMISANPEISINR
jgi:hypothetical protein